MSRHRDIQDLLGIMARLRAPDGCPWDRKQTHASILNCLIEEAYEFIDAVENQDRGNMQEELGDLLLQVVFHAQMAQESGAFEFADVVESISDKLVRRHPHVFGESKVDTAEGVQKQWDDIKQLEKAAAKAANSAAASAAEAAGAGTAAAGGSGSEISADSGEGPLGAFPRQLPAVLKAEKLQKRAAQQRFDWPDWKGPWDKVREELDELRQEAEAPGLSTGGDPDAQDRLEAEFGDLLFAAVNLGRHLRLDPERALGRANRKFVDRYGKMDKLARAEGKVFPNLTLEEMDGYWDRVKKGE